VRAVIVRINSGGGSALASDAMWHCLKALSEEFSKPVVISFGPIAASGGYYIACTGDVVFADPGTITGSIGVVSGKLSLKKLYETLGISKEVVKMSEFADIFSESRDLSPAEMELLQRGVDNMYALFTGRVMTGRKIPAEGIQKVAEGRVFTGRQAAERGLVDRIGGLMAALEYARQLAGMEPGLRVLQYPERRMPVMDLLGRTADTRALPRAARLLQNALDDISRLDEETLYLYPYHIIIR
jgi:protease IV